MVIYGCHTVGVWDWSHWSKGPQWSLLFWGGEISPSLFRPLKYGTTLEVNYEDTIDMSDLKITPEVKGTITQYVAKLSKDNHPRMRKLLTHWQGLSVSSINTHLDWLITPTTPFVLTQSFILSLMWGIGWLGQNNSLSSNLLRGVLLPKKLWVPSRKPWEAITKSSHILGSTRWSLLSIILKLQTKECR